MPESYEFEFPFELPRTTHQQKRVNTRGKKPVFFDGDKVKSARGKIMWGLRIYGNKPTVPLKGAVFVVVETYYGTPDKKKWGKWKITRPDIDNSLKLLFDCMTKSGYWNDDAQIAQMFPLKKWAEHGRTRIIVTELE